MRYLLVTQLCRIEDAKAERIVFGLALLEGQWSPCFQSLLFSRHCDVGSYEEKKKCGRDGWVVTVNRKPVWGCIFPCIWTTF